MDLKDHGVCLAHIVESLFIKFFQLRDRSILRLLEACPFIVNIVDVCPLDHLFTSLIE